MRRGELVRVRGLRWLVAGVRRFDACRLVTLAGAAVDNRGRRRRVLAPFDRVEPIARRGAPRLVSGGVWRHACGMAVSSLRPPGGLRAAGEARIDLLPHQLEPALAVVRGMATRLLLADAVGLGKTIQAGLVIAELRARAAADRVLVVTPAGLRDQWAGELHDRFRLSARVVDARQLRLTQAEITPDVNPWETCRTAVVSVDFVRRPEILAAASRVPWDVVVVDEAHAVTIDTDRRRAVEALASRAPYVLLLTATPHNGDEGEFRSLCTLGGHGEPLVAFHRTRADVGLPTTRRLHRLRVRASADERRMHALLAAFARAVRAEHREASGDGWLTLCVLQKRALSTAASLAASVSRRLAALESTADGALQLALPLPDRDEERDDRDAPSEWPAGPVLASVNRERTLLSAVLATADRAAQCDSKIEALVRLLRRTGEPAIVFTEYRDSLTHIRTRLGCGAVVLHGGLSRTERREAVETFTSGRARWLVATDAAGEGLNLHQQCRLVINLELPWNPVRLEQRIGRVDRIGQQRIVHAFHLVGLDTGETRVLRRLDARLARAQTMFGAPDPLGPPEREIALDLLGAGGGPPPDVDTTPARTAIASMRIADEARAEAARLTAARALSTARRDAAGASGAVAAEGPLLAFAKNRHTRARLGNRTLLLWEIVCEDEAGVELERSMLPVLLDLAQSGWRMSPPRTPVGAALGSNIPALARALRLATADWFTQAGAVAEAFWAARRRRALAIASAVAPARSPAQPGLFDRRVARADLLRGARGLNELVADGPRLRHARLREPVLLLVLAPPS